MKRSNLIRFSVYSVVLMMLVITAGGCQFSGANVVKGSGDVISRSHDIDFFNQIELNGVYSVILSQGPEAMLRIETDSNLHELIEITQAENTLTIATNRETVLRPTKMELHVTYPDIQSIGISGAGKVSATNKLVTEKLLLDLSGASDIQLDLDVASMHTRVSGAGNIKLSGIATNHQIELSGASNFNGEELISKSIAINLSGAGSASVNASETLDASLSGVGKITYYGDPPDINTNKTGLGSISKAQ